MFPGKISTLSNPQFIRSICLRKPAVASGLGVGGAFGTGTGTIQTGPDTFEMDGNFTIRGVTKPEKLELKVSGKGTGSGTIKGTMAFDRKDYGMNSGIPFIKIANRVEVTVDLIGKRVSGPPLVFQQ